MRLIILMLLCTPLMGQETANNEIFLFDLISENGDLQLANGQNISANSGYDNQPSFYSNEILLYARTVAGQTDIAAYNLNNGNETMVSNTKVGSEYSPVRIPGTKDVAAVRLDTTGLQRLYRYDWETGESNLLNSKLEIGYFAFYDRETILASVLSGGGMQLVLLEKEENSESNVSGSGRSLHKIPGTESMSYTAVNDQRDFDLYILDNAARDPESFFLTALPPGVQDYVWLDQGRILAGQDEKLLLYDRLGKNEWIQIADISEYNLQNITRLAVNEAGDKIAISAEINKI